MVEIEGLRPEEERRSGNADRIDAVIIHELSESQAGTHQGAEVLAQATDRPISKGARHILRAMAWKGEPPEREE